MRTRQVHIQISQSSFFNCEPTGSSDRLYLKSKHTQKSLFPRSFQSQWENSSCAHNSAQSLNHVLLFATCGLEPTRLLYPWGFPGKNTGVGCHSLLQGIFPTQGLNPHLLNLLPWHYHLCHPMMLTDKSTVPADRWPGFRSGEGRRDHFGCMAEAWLQEGGRRRSKCHDYNDNGNNHNMCSVLTVSKIKLLFFFNFWYIFKNFYVQYSLFPRLKFFF